MRLRQMNEEHIARMCCTSYPCLNIADTISHTFHVLLYTIRHMTKHKQQSLPQLAGPPPFVTNLLHSLCQDPHNSLFIISGRYVYATYTTYCTQIANNTVRYPHCACLQLSMLSNAVTMHTYILVQYSFITIAHHKIYLSNNVIIVVK
jgi:hypothetical protein